MAAIGTTLALHGTSTPRARRWWPLALLIAVALGVVWVLVAGSYDVRKVVGLCLMPAGLVWIALAGLAWQVGRLGRRRLSMAAWTLWLAYWLAGNVWLGGALMGWLERDYTRIDPLQESGFDAVLVLGGGLGRHDYGQIALYDSGDRVMLGARLYLRGRTDYLITSGPMLEPPPEPLTSVPVLTSRLWQDLGIPAERILLIENVRSTSAEIAALEQLLAERSWQRVGLVTSASHMRRAMGLCRRHGLEVAPLPANFTAQEMAPKSRHLVPQADGFDKVQAACWELLGAAARR
jgi:uncharacterized SAM-binding protein YcdF (DUF218 family)